MTRIFWVILLLGFIKCLYGSTCNKVSVCSCKDSDDSSKVIDLSKLPNPMTATYGGDKYTYSACASHSCLGYSNVAMCQDHIGSIYDNGDLTTVTFGKDTNNQITLTYLASPVQCIIGVTNRKSVVTLVCNKNIKDTFSFIPPTVPSCSFSFKLTGPSACYISGGGGGGGGGGLSVGDVLLIIFFIGFFVYFLVGALVLHFVTKIPFGTDLIIHKSFWFALPFLAKDGIMFILHNTCMKSQANSYENI